MKTQEQLVNINLGCGLKYMPGWINTDAVAGVQADLHFDLNERPWPFADNCANVVLMDNVLEHLNDVAETLREIHRILKPGGTAEIIVPYFKSDFAWKDQSHRHYFTEGSLDLFCYHHHYQAHYDFHFHLVSSRLRADNHSLKLKLRNLIPFRWWLRWFLWNMYDGVNFTLQKSHENGKIKTK